MKLKYNEKYIKIRMTFNNEKEWEPFRFKARPAKAGSQWYFNIPIFAVRNEYINLNKEYTIFLNEIGTVNIEAITLSEIKTWLSFKTSPASSGKQYRLTIPTFLIKNKYIDPIKKAKFWIFMIEEE